MEVAWLFLSGLVKLLFAVSPAIAREKEFNLGGFGQWRDAKEVATVSGARGMMASLPVILAIQTLEKADSLCKPGGIAPLLTVVAAIVVVALTIGALKFWVVPLKSAVLPFILVAVLVSIEGWYLYQVRDAAAKALCASTMAFGAGSGAASAAASTP